MRGTKTGAALAALSLILAGGPARACEAPAHLKYNEAVALDGVLKSGTGRHEVHGDFAYVYLALDQAICVDAPEGGGDEDFGNTGTDKPVDRIQIAGDAVERGLPLGKAVKVKGSLFGAHTMWHAEEVLIDASAVEPAK
jgi:hypothetical protein